MNISQYITAGKKVYMSGIGGVSMSALAHLLHRRGVAVSGSDRMAAQPSTTPVGGITEPARPAPQAGLPERARLAADPGAAAASSGVGTTPPQAVSSPTVPVGAALSRLLSLGITIHPSHDAQNIGDADCVIRTAAVHDDNPEIMEARKRGIPVFERADAWGAVMEEHRAALCISGTHGKTTTTSMAVSIAMAAGADVTAMIGGDLPGLGEDGEPSSHRVGSGDLIIAEACEYCNSFLRFRPTVAAILNIEADHLDFFSGLDDIIASFREFAKLVPDSGAVVVNADDPNALAATDSMKNITTFALKNPAAHLRAQNLKNNRGCYSFDITHPQGLIPVKLSVPGLHNVSNALCAAACMLRLGFDGVAISRGLAAFAGAARRFEYKGVLNGAVVYDDYAHHPTELAALFDAAQNMGYERVLCLFQPHTYTRTKALFDDFAAVLTRPDALCLLPIFAAREPHDPAVSSELLVARIGRDALHSASTNAAVAPDLTAAAQWLRDNARAGDLILTVGAGQAYLAAEMALNV